MQYDPNVNPIYRTFDFAYNKTVDPGQTFECKITYKPLFPSYLSVDYLFIQEKNHQDPFRVSLRGESVGKCFVQLVLIFFFILDIAINRSHDRGIDKSSYFQRVRKEEEGRTADRIDKHVGYRSLVPFRHNRFKNRPLHVERMSRGDTASKIRVRYNYI